MRIKNKAARSAMSGPGRCEACSKQCIRQTCHAISRGAGGPDHRLNTAGCGGVPCWCHERSHYGDGMAQACLLRIIARREGLDLEALERLLRRTIAAPKEARHFVIDGQTLCGHSEPICTTSDPDETRCPICCYELGKLVV